MSDAVKVDIWSDLACPWCYIGRRRFATAVEEFATDGREVRVEYHSFELSPDTPVDFDGDEVDFLVRHKGLAAEQVQQLLDQVTGIAASVGLTIDYQALKHTNTAKAHELLHLAKADGVQIAMKERLLGAYFAEGRHLGDVEELVDLAAEVGLDRESARHSLAAGTYRDAVLADQELARCYGISAVPFFVLQDKYGISGAQQSAIFVEALAQVYEEHIAG